MKKTTNLGLALYENSDKFAITASENSLNHNMELIDSAIKDTILVEAGRGINSLQQKPDSSSWTPSNSKVSEYITNNTATADGPAITTDDNGKTLVGAYGKNSTMMNAKSQTVGGRSHAEGSKTIAFENNSHAEGNETFAAGKHSHAEGNTTSAIGQAAHSEGRETLANGDFCHAEGYKTTAQGISNHAEGFLATAYGDSSHAEG
jgi:hypothetical protein